MHGADATGDQVRASLGAELALWVGIAPGGDSTVVRLRLEDLRSGEVLHASTAALGQGEVPALQEVCDALPARGNPVVEPGWASPRVYLAYLQGLGLQAAGSLPPALAELERVIALDPEAATGYAALADAAFAQWAATGDSAWVARVTEAADHALTLDPDGIAPRRTLAALALERGDSEEGLRLLREALDRDPGNPALHLEFAEACFAAGEVGSGVEALRSGIVAAPGFAPLHERLGKHHFGQAEFAEAIAEYAEAARSAAGTWVQYVYLGACYHALGCWDDARAAFERSFAIEPNGFNCPNLGFLYYMEHRFEDAREMYQWSLEFSPGDHEVLGGLGAAHYWMGDREEAEAYYRQAIAAAEGVMPPEDHADYPYTLAKFAGYHVMVDSTRAHELNQQARERAGDDSRVLYVVAENWEALGEREKSLRELGDYLKLRPDDPSVGQEPYFQELVKDPRYELLMRGLESESAECPDLPRDLLSS
jgi:tetratricopeptide (TPR) repeat protein